jgi:AcrR family transcriptional regulator
MTTARMPTASRRAQIREVAARLFATAGFHGVSIEDIGGACGISGPAVYRHYAGKDALLADLLLGTSEHLLAGGRAEVAHGPEQLLERLVAFHLDFSVGDPDIVRVHDRDLDNLAVEPRRKVRRLQRAYVELWTAALREVRPDLSEAVARSRAHACFGLLNSTPHSAVGLDEAELREQLAAMGLAALLAG